MASDFLPFFRGESLRPCLPAQRGGFRRTKVCVVHVSWSFLRFNIYVPYNTCKHFGDSCKRILACYLQGKYDIGMNKLSTAKRVSVIVALCEGGSVNSTVLKTGVSKPTILSFCYSKQKNVPALN